MTKVERIINDLCGAKRYTFVCTAQEFIMKYGTLTHAEAVSLKPYIVVCRDGMLRPR